jgi:hypothetical protein
VHLRLSGLEDLYDFFRLITARMKITIRVIDAATVLATISMLVHDKLVYTHRPPIMKMDKTASFRVVDMFSRQSYQLSVSASQTTSQSLFLPVALGI